MNKKNRVKWKSFKENLSSMEYKSENIGARVMNLVT
jgi:hypothetical protein